MNRSSLSSYLTIAIFSIAAQLVASAMAVVSAGAGHGSYRAVKLLFPYTMLSTGATGSITIPFIVLGMIQYLLYGFICAMAVKHGKVGPTAFVLGTTHATAALFAFLFSAQTFGH